MARLLAIDYGKRRTGIAVSDPLQIIANGLTTVETRELMAFLKDYLAREEVERVIIRLPKQLNNEPSENRPRVEKFAEQVQKAHPGMEVVFYDERFTSRMAQQAMIDGGLRKKQRQNKALVDEVSATIILQGYMESIRM